MPSARTEGAAELLKKWRRDDWGVNKGRRVDAPRGKGWDAASKRVGRLGQDKDWDAAREYAGWGSPRGGRKEHGCSRKRRLGWYQRRAERTWMLWGQRAGMVPRKGQGPSVAPGPCSSIQQLHKSRAEHSPPCWPLETFPSPATGPSLCLPSSDKINYQPRSGAAEEQWLMVSPGSLKQRGGDSSDKGDAEELHTKLAPKSDSVPTVWPSWI